ncbi:MAG: DUF4340 domain-containing protein [Alphaproteobacteria bacterium]
MFASQPPYMRRVYKLVIATIALVVIAIVSVMLTRAPSHMAAKPEPFFPALGAEAQQIRRIHLQDKTNKTDLAYAPETGWVVIEKDSYKARNDKIQSLIQNLRELERFEKRTSDPKWQKHLLLTDPREKDGEAELVQLLDGNGKPLAELLVGVNADVDQASGKAQIFVRKPGDNQVWLARGAGLSPLSADGGDWLDTSIIDVPKSRIARVDVAVQGASPYAVVHAKPDDENFSVENMPAGMRLKTETGANGVGTFLGGLSLRDVAGSDRITFTPDANSATFLMFNGLKIRVETTKLGNDTWVRLIPSTTDKADDQAKREAADLARRLSPWVFEIESWKASQLETKLDSIIEPVNAPKSTPDAEIIPPASTSAAGAHGDNKAALKGDKADSKMLAKPSHAETKKPDKHSDKIAPTSSGDDSMKSKKP